MVTTNQLVSPVINKHTQSSLFTETHTQIANLHGKTFVDFCRDRLIQKRETEAQKHTRTSNTNINMTFQSYNNMPSAKTGRLLWNSSTFCKC